MLKSLSAPTANKLTTEEVRRANRVRMAERMGKLPSRIDRMPWTDYCDVLAVWEAEDGYEKRYCPRKSLTIHA